MTAPWGAGALHQRLNTFVKKSLIQQLVSPGAIVCDLYCGRGVDTENWGGAKIGKYVGVDLSSSALEEAKEEWERNEKPFLARFCELNPCMADLEKHLDVDRLSVDVVTCLSHLQDCLASEDMVRQLLKNVASLLKPGGYFFGATPDSSTIWYKYQKAVEGAMKAGSLRANGQLPRVRTELYSISFEDDRFNEYGSRYQLRFTDESVPPQSQILVHFPSLIRRAEELGLECVEIQNLTEFYEDYRVPFAETLQKSCGTLVDAKGHPVVDGKSRLSPIAQDVLSLYTTFIFKKPDPQQRERALKRPAAPTPARTPARTPAPADVKKNRKISPALHLLATDDRSPKKQRLSASPAVATSNGSKIPETNPKQEKSSSSRPKPETLSKNEPGRPNIVKVAKPSGESKTGNSHANVSESKSQEKGPRPDSEARGRTSVERIQKTESPSKPKGLGGPKTESPSANKSRPFEGVHRNDSTLNLVAQELQTEGLQSHIQGSSDPDTDRPSSSGLLSESHRRSGNESGQAQVPVKRKRVSRWSSDYVPKVTSSSAGERQHSDYADKKATPARSQIEGDTVSRNLASSSREPQFVNSTQQQLRDGATTASDAKPPHDGKFNHKEGNQRKSPLSRQEPREEDEVAAEDPGHSFVSPKRERHDVITAPHRVILSETVLESIGSEPHFNGSTFVQNNETKLGPTIHKKSTASESQSQRVSEGLVASDAQPPEALTIEPEEKTMDQGKKGSVNPRPRKKEIAMDVLLDRTSSDNAVATKKRDEPELGRGSDQNKTGDMDFERDSKLSRDSPAGAHEGEHHQQKRDSNPAWETKPQRYTLRRAASQLSEGALESPPLWSRSNFTAMMERPVFQPRVPYLNPVAAGFGAGLRAPPQDRRVVPPLPGGVGLLGAGLLGAAPSPMFAGDRGLPGDRMFDVMNPPEHSRGFNLSQTDLRVPRTSLRGSLYKNDRVLPRGVSSDFVGEGPHLSLEAPWEDYFPGDTRSRINR